MPEKMLNFKDTFLLRNEIIKLAETYISDNEKREAFNKEVTELVKLQFHDSNMNIVTK